MHFGENRRWVPLKACQVSILTTQNGILFLGLHRIVSKTSKKKMKIMAEATTKRGGAKNNASKYARTLKSKELSSIDFPRTKISPFWLTENTIMHLT